MYETLLFLHVLSAFVLVTGLVMLTATAVGAPVGLGTYKVANRLTETGATLALIFGIWIVLREDFYDITDGWILGAIGLWVLATALGTMAGRDVSEDGPSPRLVGNRGKVLHWVALAATVGILVLMVWKPGA